MPKPPTPRALQIGPICFGIRTNTYSAPEISPSTPPPVECLASAHRKRGRDERLVGRRPGGERVAAFQAQGPAGRAAQQPSRHSTPGRGSCDPVRRPERPCTRGLAAGLIGNVRVPRGPADLDRGPEAWPGDAASGDPEARWTQAQNPGRTGEAQPHLLRTTRSEACASPAPLPHVESGGRPK